MKGWGGGICEGVGREEGCVKGGGRKQCEGVGREEGGNRCEGVGRPAMMYSM